MDRKRLISAVSLVLYLVFFAHGAVPHDHLRHNSFDPVCCELLCHDEDNAEHHHLPHHGADQVSDIFTLQETLDGVDCIFQLVAVIEDCPVRLGMEEISIDGNHDSNAPPLPEEACHASGGFRAPPAA